MHNFKEATDNAVRERKCDSITPVLKSLHWLPVCIRTRFKILLLTYKILHEAAPCYPQEIVLIIHLHALYAALTSSCL